jgi:CNT family concentrative nucleoside transporter
MTWAGGVVTNMLSATFAGTQVLFGQLGLPNSGAFGKLISSRPTRAPSLRFRCCRRSSSSPHSSRCFITSGNADHHSRHGVGDAEDDAHLGRGEHECGGESIFMGQTEAPLTIRPFLSKATRSELMVIMTSGMAHVSGGIMAMYIAQGVEARHLLSAVIMTSPGTILMAKMLVPETEVPATEGKVVIPKDELHKDENLHWRDCARHHRRRQAGDECGHHADQLSGAGGAARHAAGLDSRPGMHWVPGRWDRFWDCLRRWRG